MAKEQKDIAKRDGVVDFDTNTLMEDGKTHVTVECRSQPDFMRMVAKGFTPINGTIEDLPPLRGLAVPGVTTKWKK